MDPCAPSPSREKAGRRGGFLLCRLHSSSRIAQHHGAQQQFQGKTCSSVARAAVQKTDTEHLSHPGLTMSV